MSIATDDLQLVVKNTFLHVDDRIPIQTTLRRCHSEGKLSDSASSSSNMEQRMKAFDGEDGYDGSSYHGSSESSAIVWQERQETWHEPCISGYGGSFGGQNQDWATSGHFPEQEQWTEQQWSEQGPDEAWSLHISGKCKPCVYFSSKAVCLSGKNCRHCHFEHAQRKNNKPRPCKSKRMQCKQTVALMNAVYEADPELLAQATAQLSAQNRYMRSILAQQQNSKISTSSGSTHGDVGSFSDGHTSEGSSSRGASSRESRQWSNPKPVGPQKQKQLVSL
jgi:hypothetical protein